MSARLIFSIGILGAFFSFSQVQAQPAETNRMGQITMDTNQSMQHMAESMTSMSEMCKTMMQMEMKNHPLKVAALTIGGTLLSIALILEIQWIRYFSLRIRSEKMRPTRPTEQRS